MEGKISELIDNGISIPTAGKGYLISILEGLLLQLYVPRQWLIQICAKCVDCHGWRGCGRCLNEG
jgi:hypothetical protein